MSGDLPLTKDRLSQLEEPWPLHTSCQTVENASSSLLVNPLIIIRQCVYCIYIPVMAEIRLNNKP